MITQHIRRMLHAADLLAAWCEVGDHVQTFGQRDEALVEHARRVGPEAAATYAAVLARHAAAELECEHAQSLYGWPAV